MPEPTVAASSGPQEVPETTFSLEAVATELGAFIDDEAAKQRNGHLAMLVVAPTNAAIIEKSTLHLYCWRREDLAIASRMLESGQRDDGGWPYRHFMNGSVSAVNVQNAPQLDPLVNGEAASYFQLRAANTRHNYLAFRYLDFVGLISKGRPRADAWRGAVDFGLKAFLEWVEVPQEKPNASDIILRSLELAALIKDEARNAAVSAMLRAYVDTNLLTDFRVPLDLIHGYARVLPRGTALDYAALAERLEAKAEEIIGGISEATGALKQVGSPFGAVWGVAELTKDPTRINRVLRRHAERLIAHAESLAQGTGPRSHVHHWYNQAWSVLRESAQNDDLKEKVRRGLQDVGARLIEDLKEEVYEAELPPEYPAISKQMREKLISKREDWPNTAAKLLLMRIPTEAEAKQQAERDAVEFPIQQLFARRRIEDDRPVTTDSGDWRHRAFLHLQVTVMQMYWQHVLAPAIRKLYEDGFVTADVFIDPFEQRLFPPDILRAALSASSCTASGDHVGGTQQWCLLIERLIRFVIVAVGGSTTSMDRAGQGEHEAGFDAAVSELVRLIGERVDEKLASQMNVILSAFLSWRGYGFNWRNRVAHGTMPTNQMGSFSSYISYLLCVLVSTFLTATEMGDEPDEGSSSEAASAPSK